MKKATPKKMMPKPSAKPFPFVKGTPPVPPKSAPKGKAVPPVMPDAAAMPTKGKTMLPPWMAKKGKK